MLNGVVRLALSVLLGLHAGSSLSADATPFQIRVVDQETGRGVPLVELRTTHNVSFWTDSAGNIAVREPALMGVDVYFHVASHGYQAAKDGFGYRGVRLKVVPSGKATVRIKRLNRAQRLYRVTGADIYRDTILLGQDAPSKQPLINGKVFGSDSVVNAVYQNKIYWFWGDTNRPRYPLGNFHVPGAVSALPENGGRHPDQGVDLEYFLGPDGFAKATCKMPGPGPTWINGLVVLKDEERERLFATYVKIKPPLTVYERGIAEFDDSKKSFQKRRTLSLDDHVRPNGHPFHHQANGKRFVYFANPLALVRVPANKEALLDVQQYEAFTYFAAGSRDKDAKVKRGQDGKLAWSWKRNTIPPNAKLERKLLRDGKLKPDELVFQLQDCESERKINIHGASIAWNPFRNCWTMIALEAGGESSYLGEVYYAESLQPQGPWSPAIKVVTHDRYSFYNPKQHPMLAQEKGRYIYFEGTYTKMFSGNPVATPRYNYNQIMYRLDLGQDWVSKLSAGD